MSGIIAKLGSLSLGIAVVIGLVAGGFFYLWGWDDGKAHQTQISELQKQLVEQQELATKGQQLATEYEKLKVDIANLGEKIKESIKRLPSTLSESEIVRHINQLAKAANTKVLSITPQKIEKKEYYEELPIQIELEGNFAQITLFLTYISKMPRIVRVESFNLEIKDSKGVNPLLKFKGSVSGYRYIEPVAATGVK